MHKIQKILTSVVLLSVAACSHDAQQVEDGTDDSIIGGRSAADERALLAVGSLTVGDSKSGEQVHCTGTLVAEDIVLTAKHCLLGGLPARLRAAAAGEVNQMSLNGDWITFQVASSSSAKSYNAESFIVSKKSDGGLLKFLQQSGLSSAPVFGSDIAFIRLDRAVSGVRPWGLAGTAMPAPASRLAVAGLGAYITMNQGFPFFGNFTRRRGTTTVGDLAGRPYLEKYETPEGIRSAYWSAMDKWNLSPGKGWDTSNNKGWTTTNKDKFPEYIDKFLRYEMLSGYEAYFATESGDAQPCEGDSGGPVYSKQGNNYVVHAVVSGGIGKPGSGFCALGFVGALVSKEASDLAVKLKEPWVQGKHPWEP